MSKIMSVIINKYRHFLTKKSDKLVENSVFLDISRNFTEFPNCPKLGAKRMHDFIEPNKNKGFMGLRYSTPTSYFHFKKCPEIS